MRLHKNFLGIKELFQKNINKDDIKIEFKFIFLFISRKK